MSVARTPDRADRKLVTGTIATSVSARMAARLLGARRRGSSGAGALAFIVRRRLPGARGTGIGAIGGGGPLGSGDVGPARSVRGGRPGGGPARRRTRRTGSRRRTPGRHQHQHDDAERRQDGGAARATRPGSPGAAAGRSRRHRVRTAARVRLARVVAGGRGRSRGGIVCAGARCLPRTSGCPPARVPRRHAGTAQARGARRSGKGRRPVRAGGRGAGELSRRSPAAGRRDDTWASRFARPDRPAGSRRARETGWRRARITRPVADYGVLDIPRAVVALARDEGVDGGPDRIRTGDLQRDRLACWAATPRVRDRWRIIAGTPRSRHRRERTRSWRAEPRRILRVPAAPVPGPSPRGGTRPAPRTGSTLRRRRLVRAAADPDRRASMTLSASPAARSRARERWHALADRLRTIRPEALAKGAIGITPHRGVGAAGRGLVAGAAAVRRRRGPGLRRPAPREPARQVHAARPGRAPRGARGGGAARGRGGGRRAARSSAASAPWRTSCRTPMRSGPAVADLQAQLGTMPEPMRTIVACPHDRGRRQPAGRPQRGSSTRPAS